MGPISFHTANLVAREIGYRMPGGWGQGDRATNDAFRPADAYRDRIGSLLDEVVALGFEAVDLWDAHLRPGWASERHIESAREALAERGSRVVSLGGWFGSTADELEATCRIAVRLGAPSIADGRPHRFGGDHAAHVADVIASINLAARSERPVAVTSGFEPQG